MRLFIAPKRDVALFISKALGGPSEPNGASFKIDDDEVTWLSGHLLRLINPQEYDERYDTWSIDDLPMQWPISYLPVERHTHQLTAVIELAKKADELVNAGDPDPEGQRLIDELIEYAGLESKPTTRLLINDNNPMAILKASLSMCSNNDYRGLSLSALARSVCDQRYGFNLTRAYTLLARQQGYIGVLSVGRVQTPILGLIVARDVAHESHQSERYFEVEATVTIRNQPIECKFLTVVDNSKKQTAMPRQIDLISDVLSDENANGRIFNKEKAQQIARDIGDLPVAVDSVEIQEIITPTPLPHSLLSLQAEAAGKYGLKPSYVHEIAQKLRDEHMAITYHRSDSRYLNNERFRESAALIDALSIHYPDLTKQCNHAQRSAAFNSEKVTTHHAIIPTLNVPAADVLDKDEQRIYDLITHGYLVQFLPTEVVNQTTVMFAIGDYQFKAVSHRVIVQGSNNQTLLDQNLEMITRFDHGKVIDAVALQKTTSPPKRYTMKTLLLDLTRVAQYVTNPAVKKLLLDKDSAKQDEDGGIGTPATRDRHIETLFTRGFICEKDGYIQSTSVGKDFHDALPEFAVKPDMTALWHEKQKQIESGVLDYKTFISEVDEIIVEEVERAKSKGLKITVKPVGCPQCEKGHLVLRTSKVKQQFWGCSSFPECRATFSDLKGKPDL